MQPAEVAELADALASGASGRKAIGVRVPASAPVTNSQRVFEDSTAEVETVFGVVDSSEVNFGSVSATTQA